MSKRNYRYIISAPEMVGSFLSLAGVVAVFYLALWFVDFSGKGIDFITLITQPNVVNTLSTFAEVTIGIVAISLTVVTIIVELASTRYTPRITELFIRDRVNVVMMSLFVGSALFIIWVDISLYGDYIPRWMVLSELLIISINLLVILPYFAYVFDFLLPRRIIDRIERHSSQAIRKVISNESKVGQAQLAVRSSIEQLGDIGVHSIASKDKDIAITAIGGLHNIVSFSMRSKRECPIAWFDVDSFARIDQDFVALHSDVVVAICKTKSWVERKAMRQLQVIFQEAVNVARDVSHIVAIKSRGLVEESVVSGDLAITEMGLRYLNTYARHAINSSDVRTAYNLFNEFRLLGEFFLENKKGALALQVAGHLKFYGHLGFEKKIPFVLECAAYDIGSLIERAVACDSEEHDDLLTLFLDVDQEPREAGQEESLRGVRKAQALLATLYLERGDQERARRIFRDMINEESTRMRSIHDELSAVTVPEYWEISDRGKNFDFLEPARRAHLATFFGWFAESGSP